MRACIELPRDYGWGPVRVLAGRLERDGYRATEVRSPQHILLALTDSPVNCGTELSLLPEGVSRSSHPGGHDWAAGTALQHPSGATGTGAAAAR